MKLKYYNSLTQYSRRKSQEIKIALVPMGGNNPIRVQTMTNTSTKDVEASFEQAVSAAYAGSEYIRFAVPTPADVTALKEIKQKLIQNDVRIPVVADIHFNAKLALQAAEFVDKVRVNPGNFADKKRFDVLDYTDEEYQAEIERIEQAFVPLLDLCKKNSVAMRIGTNHGSLSDRIMSRFGDTPEGMAESSMEFLRLCKKHNFNNVVISMKASNTRIMVYATRLLVAKMNNEGMNFPIHLGVTEAGEGEDGRIKSAVGIGALLCDGIGDTIRVSLTEPPEDEIPVAKKLVEHFKQKKDHQPIQEIKKYLIDPYNYVKRETTKIGTLGGTNVPVVISNNSNVNYNTEQKPDFFISDIQGDNRLIRKKENGLTYYKGDAQKLLEINAHDIDASFISRISEDISGLIIYSENKNPTADIRSAIHRLLAAKNKLPVIVKYIYNETTKEDFQLKSAADIGLLFLDGLADGIWLNNTGNVNDKDIVETAFGILQASRVRTTKTEYISCPSCGRTLFSLQQTTKKIREVTSHLTGLKIGIMGCIVNGPGEMADADYGYVGAGPGKITLYKQKEVIKKNVPENEAVNELIQLLKDNGDWKEQPI